MGDRKMNYNYILLTAIVGWCVAQVLKTIINYITYKKFSFERLFGAGGWPSAHSAMVCSATAAVGRVEGPNSTFFAIMCIFALVTMYDAMGVRRAAGQHAKAINEIRRAFEEIDASIPEPSNPLDQIAREASINIAVMKEYLGHTPFEVASGALLGVLLAFIMPMSV